MKWTLSSILGVTILGLIFFGAVFGIYSLIGASIFSFLGIKFISIENLFFFMISFCIISTIVELFTDGFVQIITEFKNLDKKFSFILNFFVAIPTKVIIILIVDMLFTSIEINFLAALIAATLLFLFDYKTETLLKKIDITTDDISTSEKAINEMEEELEKFEKNFNDENKNNDIDNKK